MIIILPKCVTLLGRSASTKRCHPGIRMSFLLGMTIICQWKFAKVTSLIHAGNFRSTKAVRLSLKSWSNIDDNDINNDNQNESVNCRWWGIAEIDYSAVNEFVHAHYGTKSYFPHNHVMERIHNGRLGFWKDVGSTNQRTAHAHNSPQLVQPSLAACGFELQNAPTGVTDFENLDEIKDVYLSELRNKVIPQALKKKKNSSTTDHDDDNARILDIVFYHPMYRGEDQTMDGTTIQKDPNQLPTAPVASLVHIDNDIGASETFKEVVQLVEKNRFDDDEQTESFCPQKIVEALEAGHRFIILNMWRNANLHVPVQGTPLAIMATQYTPTEEEDDDHHAAAVTKNRICFPNVSPDHEKSRWYTFPEMTSDECLLFLQYDRNVKYSSDIWHCALSSPTRVTDVNNNSSGPNNNNGQQNLSSNTSPSQASVTNKDNNNNKNTDNPVDLVPRRSFDLRALVVLDQIVPPELDRFNHHRRRPMLSMEESECFCESQTIQRADTTSGGATASIASVQEVR